MERDMEEKDKYITLEDEIVALRTAMRNDRDRETLLHQLSPEGRKEAIDAVTAPAALTMAGPVPGNTVPLSVAPDGSRFRVKLKQGSSAISPPKRRVSGATANSGNNSGGSGGSDGADEIFLSSRSSPGAFPPVPPVSMAGRGKNGGGRNGGGPAMPSYRRAGLPSDNPETLRPSGHKARLKSDPLGDALMGGQTGQI
eukprot:Hpha_TRINITY_DN15220_c0_g4::TRINITY_DN15220_c0_g4_i3::g.64543::m.64543